jgi:hypothetical protein
MLNAAKEIARMRLSFLILLLCLVAPAVCVSAAPSASASITITLRVDPIAVVAVTHNGAPMGDRSLINIEGGKMTIWGNGLAWRSNMRAKIIATSDGGIPDLTVCAVNESGTARSAGTVALRSSPQVVVSDIFCEAGHCDLVYRSSATNGIATVVYTICGD